MEAKEKVIKTLTDFGESSTSKIAAIVGVDYYYAIKLLEELVAEDKIIKIATPNSTYWKIK
jgi:predicted transcriptional regulator